MIRPEFSNYEAIALHSLIETLGLLQVLRGEQREELLINLADDPNLQSVSAKLKDALDAEKLRQETKAGMVQGIGSDPAVYERMWGDSAQKVDAVVGEILGVGDRLPDWAEGPERLKRLKITAPPDWNEYDAYLLEGGTLEYGDWKEQRTNCTASCPTEHANPTEEPTNGI